MTRPKLALSPKRQAALLDMLKQEGLAAPAVTRVEPRATGAAAPLSFAQQRLWFLNQLDPACCAYNIPLVLRLRGCLNMAALVKALNEIVQRHEILRTRFHTVGGRAMQTAEPHTHIPLPLLDLQSAPADRRETHALGCIAQDSRFIFNLEHGRPLRATLYRINDDHHLLLILVHHIVADDLSLSIIFNELAVLYDAYATGHNSPLSTPEIQFADFATWQRNSLTSETLADQIKFWRCQLAENGSVLTFPAPVRSIEAAGTARQRSLALDAETVDGLRKLGRQEGATFFMTLLAAFKTALLRFSSGSDLCVGIPFSGRNRPEVQRLIGFFVNTLALRTDLAGTATFREVLKRVRETCSAAFVHADAPFDLLVSTLCPKRASGSTPYFRAFFSTLQPLRLVGCMQPAGLSIDEVDFLQPAKAKFDVAMYVRDADATQCTLVYDASALNDSAAEQLARGFSRIAERVARAPDENFTALASSTAEEAQRIDDFNAVLDGEL